MSFYKNIDYNTKIVGIIGHPIRHSLSPMMHNLSFETQKLNYVYLPFDVPTSNLKGALKSLSLLGIRGLNVTLPHKEKILQYMDHVSEEASMVGAVNTVVNEGNQLFGYNTDINGIVETLMPFKDNLNKSTATVIGAGGAARGVIFSLIRHFKVDKINIINRTEEKSEAIKDYFKDKMHFTAIYSHELMAKENVEIYQASNLIINTTSLGLFPNIEDSPTDIAESFNSNQIVFDLIYNPIKTKFLQFAESQNATILDGLQMFVVQGAKSYELWSGNEMQYDFIYNELRQKLISTEE